MTSQITDYVPKHNLKYASSWFPFPFITAKYINSCISTRYITIIQYYSILKLSHGKMTPSEEEQQSYLQQNKHKVNVYDISLLQKQLIIGFLH